MFKAIVTIVGDRTVQKVVKSATYGRGELANESVREKVMEFTIHARTKEQLVTAVTAMLESGLE